MPCSNLRFLVVEDHEIQSRVLAQLLKTMGAREVYTAHDGQAAIRVIGDPSRPVDIVVTDLSMPGMDGMEFIRHLSEARSSVSVVLASALEPKLVSSIANMARVYNIKLLGAIRKPLTAAKLVPLIELYRSIKTAPEDPEAGRVLEEVAEAWSLNQFEPCYEPRIDLATGQVLALHAVPQWAHPVLGSLNTDLFMPSIKAHGLNDDFVWLMVQKSAAQCRLWQAEGQAPTVSVNVPFDTLADVNLADRIKHVAEKEGIEPRQMVLGIAEAALRPDMGRILENLARLRVAGFGLAIDDFGGGEMAVERLSAVAFTELGIRSSFVRSTDANDAARAELAVAVEFANELKLKLVAHGIRSKEEWAFLKDRGCDYGQGPMISKPLEKGALLAWLTQWQGSAGQKDHGEPPRGHPRG